MTINPDDLLIFKVRKEARGRTGRIGTYVSSRPQAKKSQTYESIEGPARPAYTPPSVGEHYVETAVKEEVEPFAAQQLLSKKGAAKTTKKQGESREAAKGLFCAWHPWRQAYALCNYCHRPFCFEDIAEHAGNYYCLEDMGAATANGGAEEETRMVYNRLSIVSGTLLMLTFVLFLYFASGQVTYIFGYASNIGPAAFFTHINYTYGIALAETVATVLSFIAAVFILAQSSKGFGLGLAVGLVNTALFSYSYLNSGTIYMAIISAVAFVALIALAYSRATYAAEETETTYGAQDYQTAWPNPGRF